MIVKLTFLAVGKYDLWTWFCGTDYFNGTWWIESKRVPGHFYSEYGNVVGQAYSSI